LRSLTLPRSARATRFRRLGLVRLPASTVPEAQQARSEQAARELLDLVDKNHEEVCSVAWTFPGCRH